MDIQVRTENYVIDDHSWLDDEHLVTRSVTLDVAAFTAEDHYPDGYLKSGAALGLITATNLYGPYDNTAEDGRETNAGHLRHQVRIKSGVTRVSAPLLIHGFIKRNKVPYSGVAGGIDTAGETDVKGLIAYRTA